MKWLTHSLYTPIRERKHKPSLRASRASLLQVLISSLEGCIRKGIVGKTYGRSNKWIRLLWEEIGLRCYMEQNEPCLLGLSFHEKAQVTGAAYWEPWLCLLPMSFMKCNNPGVDFIYIYIYIFFFTVDRLILLSKVSGSVIISYIQQG